MMRSTTTRPSAASIREGNIGGDRATFAEDRPQQSKKTIFDPLFDDDIGNPKNQAIVGEGKRTGGGKAHVPNRVRNFPSGLNLNTALLKVPSA